MSLKNKIKQALGKKQHKEPIYIRHPFIFEPLPEALLIQYRKKEGKPISPFFFKEKSTQKGVK